MRYLTNRLLIWIASRIACNASVTATLREFRYSDKQIAAMMQAAVENER